MKSNLKTRRNLQSIFPLPLCILARDAIFVDNVHKAFRCRDLWCWRGGDGIWDTIHESCEPTGNDYGDTMTVFANQYAVRGSHRHLIHLILMTLHYGSAPVSPTAPDHLINIGRCNREEQISIYYGNLYIVFASRRHIWILECCFLFRYIREDQPAAAE